VTRLVVDTSAVAAILLREAGYDELLDAFDRSNELLMSAPTRVELSIVIEAKKGPAGTAVVDQLVRDTGLDIVPFDVEMASRALAGWRRFGKGRHRAGLNLGDCFTYAVAVEQGAPVLCVGDDFARTDVEVVRPTGNR
jgi:ribonuclease VapC